MTSAVLLVSVAIVVAVQCVFAAVPADQVTNLPGFGAPVSKMYSGYLPGSAGQQAHYIYTESLNTPATDPVVLWFNGGPGCSSLEGLFSESGLYHVQEFSSPVTLYQNPWSWGNFSNNLFIEAPAGVGFSYCERESACQHTDTSTANDNLAVLVSFFNRYPELQKNGFWISGESYAGIYVPSLAYAVYNYNQASPAVPINLKGILVGNGCLGTHAGHCGQDLLNDYHDVMQWRGHGLIAETTYDKITQACDWSKALQTPACDAALALASTEIGNIDVYYLYNTCSDPAVNLRAPVPANSMLARINAIRAEKGEQRLTLDPNCFGTGPALESYLNRPESKAALHVATDIVYALCSNNASFGYSPDIRDERTTIYPTLTLQAKYKVLIYNGEADLCVPYTDNEWWTRSMNYTVLAPWRAWSVQGAEGAYVGGYAIQYANSFTFATVRGAGHMVPETRPEAALTMFRNHVFGKAESAEAWN